MAHALQIDTLAFTKKLREAGADEKLAEAIVEGLTAADTSALATKTDVAAVKTDLAEVKAELKTDIAAVKTDLAAVKADVAAVKDGLMGVSKDIQWVKWIGGATLTVLILPLLAEVVGRYFN